METNLSAKTKVVKEINNFLCKRISIKTAILFGVVKLLTTVKKKMKFCIILF